MIEQLVARRVSPQEIAKVVSGARFRSVDGELYDQDQVAAALVADDPRIDPGRWFTEHPLVDEGRTWVVSRMWGRNTEPTLTALAQAFPEAKLSFRAAQG